MEEVEKRIRRKEEKSHDKDMEKKVGRMEQGNKKEKHHYNRNKYRRRDKKKNGGRMA